MTEITTTTEKVELGTQLRRAREALNLSIEDVSKKINLRPTILSKLENNQFDHAHIPATFVRGYLRSYLKFLKLPEALLDSSGLVLGEETLNSFNTRIKKVAHSQHSSHRWLNWVTWSVVLFVVAMTVLWWWENHQLSNTEREHLVENYTTTQIIPKKSTENPDVSSASVSGTQGISVVPENSDASSTVTENAIPVGNNTQSVESSLTDTSVITEKTQLEQNEHIASEVQSTEKSLSQMQNQKAEVSNVELRIEVTGTNCWLSVQDHKGKVLAQKEYKQGEVLTFNAGSPYSLIIGAPSNVQITYQGNDVPLKVDGRVAKFKLPIQ